ncbi:MAG: thioredoxin [Anaerolineae bacterium UTCFX2]|jgi:thioredoxin 1|nr:thioredoxin [Anaerolineales bacterium]OQY94269.1 MAG: thioredoxin [Anaerolineae bacterium UTCFX2]
MAEIQKTSENTFQQQVLDADLPVLVDFTAVWCQPCKQLDPIVKQLAQDWDGKVKVFKLDVDDNPQIAIDYQIMGVPTLMLFKSGQPIERVSGLQSKDRLQNKFLPHLS